VTEQVKNKLSDAISNDLNQKITIILKSSATEIVTPHTELAQKIKQNPQIQKIIKKFDANVLPESIKAL